VACGTMAAMTGAIKATPHRLPDFADRVLAAAEGIPPGRVQTYGDIASRLGEGGPRQVGRVMALYGGAVPWWRVVRADGRLLPGHERRALAEYRAEGTPLRDSGVTGDPPRLDLRRARWHPDETSQTPETSETPEEGA
jgi:alkylated DNA nucleotide flippase Atl1